MQSRERIENLPTLLFSCTLSFQQQVCEFWITLSFQVAEVFEEIGLSEKVGETFD